MKYRAFVVDDYEEVRAFIAEALHARDFEVRGFSEAEAAIAAFDAASLSEQPDLVVIDLHGWSSASHGAVERSQAWARVSPACVIVKGSSWR